jgi:hypothetical protein
MKQIAIRPLSPRETALLNECEETIAAGLTTFIEVGGALLTINEGRLYRRDFATFDEYCTARWQIGRAYAYRLMDAVRALLTIGDTDLPLPTNEAQARELARVPEHLRTEVWQRAHELTDGQPTAAVVRTVALETAGLAGPAPDAEQASTASGTAAAGEPAAPAAAPDHPDVQTSDAPGEGAGSAPAPAAGGAASTRPPAAPDSPTGEPAAPGEPTEDAPLLNPPSGDGGQGVPVPSPAGTPCEKCGERIATGQAAEGYTRCDDCDPDGEHVDHGEGCRGCRIVAETDPAYVLSFAENEHGLHLECGECDGVVAHLKPGGSLPEVLAAAREHHRSCS